MKMNKGRQKVYIEKGALLHIGRCRYIFVRYMFSNLYLFYCTEHHCEYVLEEKEGRFTQYCSLTELWVNFN